jgi:hypothetical protein
MPAQERVRVDVSTRQLPLRGADLVLVAMQALWKGAVTNNALLIVQCEGALSTGRITRALERFLDACPWPAARLRRPFPWGALHWAAGPRASLTAPVVRQGTATSTAELQTMLEDELNLAVDPRRGAPLRVLVVDGGPRTSPGGVLVLTWFHPLMDPRGAQNLLAQLAQLDRDDGRAAARGGAETFVRPRDPRPLRERGRIAQRSLEYMRTLTRVTPVSPGTGMSAPGPARFRRASFTEPEGGAGAPRAERDISARLAVVARAMAELWERRKLPDIPFFVPIAVDLRPKGEPGPTFGNVLAFHFAHFAPSETADPVALAKRLRQQMADAVRDGQVEANGVAMDFLKYRPVSMMLRELPGTASGETFSFNCADVTDFPPELDSCFGRRIVNAYHVPAVLPRPGIGVFFNRCQGKSNIVVSWIEGAVGEDDVMRIIETVGKGLGWSPSP